MTNQGALLSAAKAAAIAVVESELPGVSGKVWSVSPDKVEAAAAILLSNGFDSLENLSCREDKTGHLVFSAFLRSEDRFEQQMVLRWSVPLVSLGDFVASPSVRGFWLNASSFEQEAAALLGVRFQGQEGTSRLRQPLPEDWDGFPLRKRYVFPIQYLEIPHSRPAGQAPILDAQGGAELPT